MGDPVGRALSLNVGDAAYGGRFLYRRCNLRAGRYVWRGEGRKGDDPEVPLPPLSRLRFFPPMTSSTKYAPRRAFSSAARHMRSLPSSDNADSTVDLLPDDLLPGMMATRQARRRTMQNKAILTSLVGLALVVIVAVSTAFALTDSPGEPFAVETEAEIVTMQDLASA